MLTILADTLFAAQFSNRRSHLPDHLRTPVTREVAREERQRALMIYRNLW